MGSSVLIWSCSLGLSSSSASSERIQVPVHFAMAEFLEPEKPCQASSKTLALKERAISTVRSVEDESRIMISSANCTLARVRAQVRLFILGDDGDGERLRRATWCQDPFPFARSVQRFGGEGNDVQAKGIRGLRPRAMQRFRCLQGSTIRLRQ